MPAALTLAFALAASSGSLSTLVVDGVDVDVYTPAGAVRGDVLVLPGWDSNKADWCKNGGLCDEAERRGLRLVMPEMKKSVYADRIYPETRAPYRTQLTRTHLEDAIAQLMRERGLLARPSTTFCLGRSTGGRGCVLLALDHPEWFRAAASLSGDFDQTKTPYDPLMTGAYGAFAAFPARWHQSENPQERVASLAVPLYLGHGAKDPVVDPGQTTAFAAAVRAARPHLDVVVHLDPDGKHDHRYWRRELPPVFDFFAGVSGRQPAGSR